MCEIILQLTSSYRGGRNSWHSTVLQFFGLWENLSAQFKINQYFMTSMQKWPEALRNGKTAFSFVIAQFFFLPMSSEVTVNIKSSKMIISWIQNPIQLDASTSVRLLLNNQALDITILYILALYQSALKSHAWAFPWERNTSFLTCLHIYLQNLCDISSAI